MKHGNLAVAAGTSVLPGTTSVIMCTIVGMEVMNFLLIRVQVSAGGVVSYKTVLFAPGRRPGAAPLGRYEDGLTPEGLHAWL